MKVGLVLVGSLVALGLRVGARLHLEDLERSRNASVQLNATEDFGSGDTALWRTDWYTALGSKVVLDDKPVTTIGIGMQKCGTTFLWSVLEKHPDVTAGPKEAHYFSQNRSKCRGTHRYNGRPYQRYINACFFGKRPRVGQTTVEFDPDYASYVKTGALSFRKLKSIEPETQLRFLVALRDPRERLASYVNMARRDGWAYGTSESISAALASKLLRHQQGHLDAHVADGEYHTTIQRWVQKFPAASLLIVNQQALNDVQTWRRIFAHIGLKQPEDWEIKWWLRDSGTNYNALIEEQYTQAHVDYLHLTTEVTKSVSRYYDAHDAKLWKALKMPADKRWW